MLTPTEKFRIVSFVMILAVAITCGYFVLKTPPPLPIYNPSDLNPELVDSNLQGVRKDHKIGRFDLWDQNGKQVTEKTFEGKVYVADFFFTTCGSICPVMTSEMKKIQDHFAFHEDVMLLSHTVTPDIDSVETLKSYAIKHGALDEKWKFVTGSKKKIYELARQHYFAVLDKGDGGVQDFIHTENFVLIDKNKRIRGYCDGTNPEEVEELIDKIEQLLKE